MTSVFVFHAVTDAEWFDHVVQWLRSRYRMAPLSALLDFRSGAGTTDNICHITADDGHRSFYDVIFPVLKKYSVPASLFVSPAACAEQRNFWFQEIDGYCRPTLMRIAADALEVPVQLLNEFSVASVFKAMPVATMTEVIAGYQQVTGAPAKPCQNVSVSELREMAASGLVSLGAHTVAHPILMNEPDTSCEYEIGASVRALSALVGSQVSAFAYPNGIPGMDFGTREEALLRSSGIHTAFTTESRHVRSGDNALRIPRLGISDKESIFSIRAKVLFGSGWGLAKRIARTGEMAERQRLNDVLSAFQSRPPASPSPLVQADANEG